MTSIPAGQRPVLPDFTLPGHRVGDLFKRAEIPQLPQRGQCVFPGWAFAGSRTSWMMAVTFNVAVRNSTGNGRCNVPSASASKIAVIVLMGEIYIMAPPLKVRV